MLRTSRGWSESMAFDHQIQGLCISHATVWWPLVITSIESYLLVGVALKWFVSQTPYLIHETSKTPYITGCGVLFIVQSLDNRTQCSLKVMYMCIYILLEPSISQGPGLHVTHSRSPHPSPLPSQNLPPVYTHIPCTSIEAAMGAYFANPGVRDENVASCKVSVDKGLPSEVAHACCNMLAETEARLSETPLL